MLKFCFFFFVFSDLKKEKYIQIIRNFGAHLLPQVYITKTSQKRKTKKKTQAKKDALCCITSSPSYICPFPNITVFRSYVLYIHHRMPNLCVTQIQDSRCLSFVKGNRGTLCHPPWSATSTLSTCAVPRGHKSTAALTQLRSQLLVQSCFSKVWVSLVAQMVNNPPV